jgi:hypothetical protein
MVACTHRRPCFLCGSLEHERNQCDNGMCFRCRKPGHQARDCKASLGELAKLKEKTVTHCLRCGRDGHNMTACTRSALTHTHLIWTDKGSPSVHLDNFSTPQNRAQSRLKRALIGSIFAPALHTALSVSSSPLSLSLSLSLPLSLSLSLPLAPSRSHSRPPSIPLSLSLSLSRRAASTARATWRWCSATCACSWATSAAAAARPCPPSPAATTAVGPATWGRVAHGRRACARAPRTTPTPPRATSARPWSASAGTALYLSVDA